MTKNEYAALLYTLSHGIDEMFIDDFDDHANGLTSENLANAIAWIETHGNLIMTKEASNDAT